MRIGFVLLTHNRIPAALRLLAMLDRLYDRPVVAWHHDLAQTPLDRSLLDARDNIHVIANPVHTRWGSWSLVEAVLHGIDSLYADKTQSPDYFYVVSGACFPIRPAAEVINDLTTMGGDFFGQARPVDGTIEREWDRECHRRYCTKKIFVPWFSKRKLRPIWKQFTVSSPPWGWPFFPFNNRLKCWAGGQWIAGSRKLGKMLPGLIRGNRRLVKHYEKVWIPDESIFQTVACSSPQISVKPRPLTFSSWDEGASHPHVMTMNDLPRLQASGAHFARKFDADVDDEIIRHFERTLA